MRGRNVLCLSASINECFLMFQRPLGHIFLLPAFSSHLLCTTPQEAGWVFCDLCEFVCVWVCAVGWRGAGDRNSLSDVVLSLSILGSGQEVGSTEETWPPPASPLSLPLSSYFSLYSLFLPLSPPSPLSLRLPIHKVTPVFFWSRVLSYGCHIHFCGVPERTLNYTLLTSCVNKSMLTSDF